MYIFVFVNCLVSDMTVPGKQKSNRKLSSWISHFFCSEWNGKNVRYNSKMTRRTGKNWVRKKNGDSQIHTSTSVKPPAILQEVFAV